MRPNTRARHLIRHHGVAVLAVMIALAFAPNVASAEQTWEAPRSVSTPGGWASAIDSTIFRGSTYTVYPAVDTTVPIAYTWRIMRHSSDGLPAWSTDLGRGCLARSTADTGTSMIVAFDKLHVFARHPGGAAICHAWSTDGTNFSVEYWPVRSYAEGITTAVWSDQLHVVARGVDGSVQHAWSGPSGLQGVERLDAAAVTDDMSAYGRAAIVTDFEFHVLWIGPGGSLIDRTYRHGQGWRWTGVASAPYADRDSGLAAAWGVDAALHAYYRSSAGDIVRISYDTWFSPVWRPTVLSQASAYKAEAGTRIRAFAYGDNDRVFYGAANGRALVHVQGATQTPAFMRLDAGNVYARRGLSVVASPGLLDIYVARYQTAYDGQTLRLLRFSDPDR